MPEIAMLDSSYYVVERTMSDLSVPVKLLVGDIISAPKIWANHNGSWLKHLGDRRPSLSPAQKKSQGDIIEVVLQEDHFLLKNQDFKTQTMVEIAEDKTGIPKPRKATPKLKAVTKKKTSKKKTGIKKRKRKTIEVGDVE